MIIIGEATWKRLVERATPAELALLNVYRERRELIVGLNEALAPDVFQRSAAERSE